MLNSIRIKKVKSEDYEDVISLLNQLDLPPDGVFEHFEHFFVAKQDKEVIGVAGMEVYGNIGLVRSVGVAKNSQGLGLGRSMIEMIHRYAEENDLTKLFLFTDTAELMFLKFGYKTIQRHEIDERLKKSAEFKICESAPTMVKLLKN
jgi:amino-acid N-acetyltransferase